MTLAKPADERRGSDQSIAPERGATDAEELAYWLRQQELAAEFGLFALGTYDVDAFLQEATWVPAPSSTTFIKTSAAVTTALGVWIFMPCTVSSTRGASIWKSIDQWLASDLTRERQRIADAACKMVVRIEAEAKKRAGACDHRSVGILDLARDVAVPVDEEAVEDGIEAGAQVDVFERPAPTAPAVAPALPTSRGG